MHQRRSPESLPESACEGTKESGGGSELNSNRTSPPFTFFARPKTFTLCTLNEHTMSSEEEGKALGHSEFWDERYTKADGDKPTHEWFRTFDALEPFFEKYLFKARGDAGKTGKMLHLGSGDSVCPSHPPSSFQPNQIT
jgi:hypothetical protein